MFDITLNEPKKKKRKWDSDELKQPLPIPIATLTGIKADDSLWRFYHGKLDPNQKTVRIEIPQEASFLEIWGYFGSRGNPKFKKRKAATQGKGSNNTLVILEDFEPVLVSGAIKEGITAPSVACQENANEDSDVEEICEDEEVEYEGAPLGGARGHEDIEEEGEEDAASTTSATPVDPGKQTLQLSPVEAFFLAFGLGCLLVERPEASFVEDPELSIDDLWRIFCSSDKDFPYQYAVYHHFRAKGYVVKDGTKFGCDFLLYKEGPPFYHAQYSVRIMQPQQNVKWQFMSGLNRVTESAGKELMLAQITEIQDDSESLEETQTVKQKLKNIQVKEVLLRRYVPSQERESGAVDSKEPSKAKSASPPKEALIVVDQLINEITAAGNKVRDLKSKKAKKAEIDSAVAALLDLKAKYKAATGQDWKPHFGLSLLI